MKPIVEVRNIGKRYNIHHQRAAYLNFRERILDVFRSGGGSREEFWALKNISFDVKAGESVGIIGRNGAGKSTLLKILSRITPPSTGSIISRGRVASLLEVGTGFHPELTGRENVFFNGSLLGMKTKEIQSKFDEIVEFSGVEKFLDTPLKHYSSGMQLRLAFSVAAFLEPEILIVDEVLAVGDAEFQKKCMGKMEDVGKSGRTVLFVSHNMAAVRTLCQRSILLENGTVVDIGSTESIVSKYLLSDEDSDTPGRFDLSKHPSKRRQGEGVLSCTLLRDGVPTDVFYSRDNLKAQFEFFDPSGIQDLVFGIVIKDNTQQALIGLNNLDLGLRLNARPINSGTVVFEIESLPLYGDSVYSMDIYFGDGGNNYDVIQDAIKFKIRPSDVFGNGRTLRASLNIVHPGRVNFRINDLEVIKK